MNSIDQSNEMTQYSVLCAEIIKFSALIVSVTSVKSLLLFHNCLCKVTLLLCAFNYQIR